MNWAVRVVAVACVVATTGASSAAAAFVEFVPPNDPSVHVVSLGGDNDGFSAGRGVSFSLSADTDINSIGIFLDFTDPINLTVNIDQVGGGNVFNDTDLVSIGGPSWYDFSTGLLTLDDAFSYRISFSFTEDIQNGYYYRNNNIPFTVFNFTGVDGFLGANSGFNDFPRIRVDAPDFVPPAIPEPGSIVLSSIAGLGMIGGAIRRRRQKVAP